MKKYLMFIVALLAPVMSLKAVCQSCVPTTVYACEDTSCRPGRFYVSGFGGVNFFDAHKHHDVSVKFHPGYVGGFAIGYQRSFFRTEAEFAYRSNNLKKVRFYEEDTSLKGYSSSFSIMANGYLDLHNPSIFTPYVGVGAGYVNSKSHFKVKVGSYEVHGPTEKSDGFAWQGIAGVSMPIHAICKNMHVGIEYRYFAARKHVTEQNVGITARYIF